jgi:hypothetical protein
VWWAGLALFEKATERLAELECLVPKSADAKELRFSPDELREIHLALAVRVAQLMSTDTRKMGPTAKAKLQRRVDLCNELHHAVQKARGKNV